MLVNILLGIMIGLSVVCLVSMILTLVTEKLGFGITFISSMLIAVVLMIVVVCIK